MKGRAAYEVTQLGDQAHVGCHVSREDRLQDDVSQVTEIVRACEENEWLLFRAQRGVVAS